MQPKLEKILGQPLIIENRAGAGGIIAMDALSKSKPDGYTIGMGASGSLATSPALGETVPYDPLKSFRRSPRCRASRSCWRCRGILRSRPCAT